MLTRLLAARRPRGDAGISLMELVVAMTLTVLLGTLAVNFFVTTNKSGLKTELTNQSVADARVTLDSWTSMLRVATWLDSSAQTDRFEEITPTKIVFYANLDNRTTADQQVGAPTKVVLMLRQTNPTTGDGQLVQVIFGPDNATPTSVRQLAFNVTPTGGAGQPVFQPYNEGGGPVDVTQLGCESGNTPVAGLCLQTAPTGAGMLDPQLGSSSLAVSGGPLRGNPAVNVDTTLQSIAGVTVAFTATDPNHLSAVAFSGGASVNSGFPS
jgi:Tfp pilus assembly protein PilW